MRKLLSSIFSAAICAVALSTDCGAASALPKSDVSAPSAKLILVDARCGRGWHWVPAGYAKHAKWRAAHCARD
jgi:hypothetical protein